MSLTLLALAALLGAVAALGVRSLFFAGESAPSQPTVSRQLPPSLDELLLRSDDGRTLNDVAFALIGAHEYARALPFARKAVRKTAPGSLTRGYATFNLGYALLQLGYCRESLGPLRRALTIEPPQLHKYIRPRIKEAERCAPGGASAQAPSRSSAGQPDPSPTP